MGTYDSKFARIQGSRPIDVLMIPFLHRAQIPFLVLLTLCSFLAACSCEKDKKSEPQSKPPARLVFGGVPSRIKVEIYPVEGTIAPRPVHIVFAREPSFCSQVREARRRLAHVLCLPVGFQGNVDQAAQQMKEGLRFFKDKYRRYVSGSPAHLLADEAYTQLGFSLMLQEPLALSHGYLAGFRAEQLTSAALYGLFHGGAKTLALKEGFGEEQARLRAMATRGGLLVRALGDGPQALSQALSLLQERDPRLDSSAAQGRSE